MPGSSPGMTSGDACTSTSISNSSRLRTRFRDLAECFFREVFIYSRPLRIEGAGNAGRSMRPRSRVQDVIESAHEHTGHTGITRHSPRNGFNGYSVISPVLRAFWPPSPALLLADLTPASGCQDHTTSHVRINTVRYRRIRVHRIPPRERDDRDSPLCWDGTAAN